MKRILKYCFNTSAWNPTKTEYIFLLSSIPRDERERVSRYVFKRDAKQTLLGQVLIRYCLKTLLSTDTNNLCIARNAKERPYLKVKETLAQAKINNFEYLVDFNVSHSGDYTIICAGMISCSLKKLDELEGAFRIGTDVMKIDVRSRTATTSESDESLFEKEIGKHERVIESEFSELEKNFIYSKSNPVEKLSAFYRLWCLKESYVKALGDGIGFDIKRVESVPTSELLIDLIRKKHLVVDDTKLMVDSKLVKTCKFYEQYFTSSCANVKDNANNKVQLHVMTVCVIEKEKLSKASSSAGLAACSPSSSASSSAAAANHEVIRNEMDEFVELNLTDIMPCLMPIEKQADDTTTKEFEENWQKFAEKAESPFVV